MGIRIGNVVGYDVTTNLLSASLSNAFTGINAIAGLISDRKSLQTGTYKRLLKEYYNTVEPAKPDKKTEIFNKVKQMSQEEATAKWEEMRKQSYDMNAQYIGYQQMGMLMDSFV